ncbi:MAG: DUF1786 family protein [Candidatus Helarchaeota archaeon]
MKVVAFDVGIGTIDTLIWDSNEINIYKMVMPSPCQYFSKRIRSIESDLFIDGIEMGGSPVSQTILDHINKGYKVYMTNDVWRTIKYNKKKIIEKGIIILDNKEKDKIINKNNIEKLFLTDVEIDYFFTIFKKFALSTDFDYIGIAVQDHGNPPRNQRATNFRREWIVDILKHTPYFDNFLFSHNKIPDFLSRTQAISNYIYKKTSIPVYICDTIIAAMKGCLYDPNIKNNQKITIDIGNGHTAGFSIDNNEIIGYFEYHTHAITPQKLEWSVNRLSSGDLTNQEVLENNGHGAFVKEGLNNTYDIIVTGPKRFLIKNTKLKYILGAPFGDHMITGAVGLLKLILQRIEFE